MPRRQDVPMIKLPDGSGISIDLIKMVRVVNKGLVLLAGPDDVLAMIACDAETAKLYCGAIVDALQQHARGRTLPPMPWDAGAIV